MMRNIACVLALVGFGCGGGAVGKGVREDIHAQMMSADAALSACYGEALAAKPGLSGKVTVAFLVEPKSGKFTKVKVRSKKADPALESCVVKAVGDLRLSKPQPVPVLVDTYPLEFSPAAP